MPRNQFSHTCDTLLIKTDTNKKKRSTEKLLVSQHKKKKKKTEKTRQQTRERVRKYCEKKQTEAQEYNNSVDSPGFANRTSKKCATDKVKKTLPSTPQEKAEIVQSIVKSPWTRKVLCESSLLKTPEEEKETENLRGSRF